MEAAPVLLYDGVCVLCSRTVRFTLAHERSPTIRFVAIQSGEGRALAQAHGIDSDAPHSFLFIEGGRAFARSDGALALARHFRGSARLLGLMRVVPRPLRDAVYDLVARHRYRWFGRKDSCELPSAADRRRFTLPETG